MEESRTLDRRIRVLQFADVVNRHDFIDVIIRNADRTRFDVSVCTLGRPSNIADPAFEAAGIRNRNLHSPARKQYVRAVLALASLLRRERIDVIHAHHYEPGVIAATATLLHPHTQLVVGRHYSDAIYLNTKGIKRNAMLSIEALTNLRCRRIIAPSSMIADLLHRQGVPDDKVKVIPYAFEEQKFDVGPEDVERVRSELHLDGRQVIGTFARLYRDKGHRYLLDALPDVVRQASTVLWLVVGEGAEKEDLARHVRTLGLEAHVEFLGWRRDSLALMSAVDLVVQPTLQEAFSQVMIEALWLGKPLVMTDVSGVTDVIEHDVHGLIAAPADSDQLSRAVTALLRDPARAARLAAAGQHRVHALLGVKQVVPQVESVYSEVS